MVWDELSAGDRSLVGVCEGPEAAQPFRPDIKPIDAYAALLLDTIDMANEHRLETG